MLSGPLAVLHSRSAEGLLVTLYFASCTKVLATAVSMHFGICCDTLLHLASGTGDEQHASLIARPPQDYFDAEPTFKQSYAPQSGEIFGILAHVDRTF